jgi:peptidoglycan/LPS O-acetylase OafA/YrhL
MIIVAYVMYWLLVIIIDKRMVGADEWHAMLYKVLFLQTIIPNHLFSWVGPWWFWAIIFQLYLLMPPLYCIINRYRLRGLLCVCAVSYIATYIVQYCVTMPQGVSYMANSIAHLPEFCFGIYIALSPQRRLHPSILTLSALVFVLGNFFYAFFPLTYLCVTIFCYYLINNLCRILGRTKRIAAIVYNIGAMSMALFIVHGPLRSSFIAVFSSHSYTKLLGALCFFMAAYGAAVLANMLYRYLLSKMHTMRTLCAISG